MLHGLRPRRDVTMLRICEILAALLPAGTVVQAADTVAMASTDFETRMGPCKVPVPQAFSCRSIPEWGSFLTHIQQNAEKGFPLDPLLYQMAQNILVRWQDKPYPPQDFYRYLCGGPEAQWPLPDGFCLFGFVGALLVRSRHLMELADDLETRKTVEMDFSYATTVLGKEGSVDFLDSSPWPVSILDAYINMNETEFMTYNKYKMVRPIPPPAVPLESLHWQPEPLQTTGKAMQAAFQVAVVGTHATLSLEPVDMLRRFVEDAQMRTVFFGLEPRWCQILGICDQGTAALSQLFKGAEKDPYAYSWTTMLNRLGEIFDTDQSLGLADLLLCTEPLAGCLMLRQVAEARGRRLPILGYFGVALLNSCPPDDLANFWAAFAKLYQRGKKEGPSAVLAVNNLILSEQIFYQSGKRMPYVRAHGLYTGMAYVPLKATEVLVWRAPLFLYSTARCAIDRFMQGMPEYPITFRFMEEDESLPYKEVGTHKAITLIPWDHALMTFYEIYSARIPLLMPAPEWMYRFLYQRGQLSVGERMYQSIMPGHTPPHAEFADAENFKEKSGPPEPSAGLGAAKAARGVAEDMLTRGLAAPDVAAAKQYMKAALELVQDMRYFLTVAENRTHEDSYSSMGVIRRSSASPPERVVSELAPTIIAEGTAAAAPSPPWHPYTPFQMSTRDSNDWTRMRKGGWWLRRGVRFDAMRYWYQFSDFARFPGIQYFANLPELICIAKSVDIQQAAAVMKKYNDETLVHSATFWVSALFDLMASPSTR